MLIVLPSVLKMIFRVIIVASFLSLASSIIDPRRLHDADGKHNPTEFSFTALVRHFWDNPLKYSFTCGGTILDEKWILTSAHCVQEYG